MANVRTIELTPAQLSALQCAGILDANADDLDADEQVLRLSVRGTRLVVSPNTRDSIWRAVNAVSNADDEQSRALDRKEPAAFLARCAARASANLLTKISRLRFDGDER